MGLFDDEPEGDPEVNHGLQTTVIQPVIVRTLMMEEPISIKPNNNQERDDNIKIIDTKQTIDGTRMRIINKKSLSKSTMISSPKMFPIFNTNNAWKCLKSWIDLGDGIG